MLAGIGQYHWKDYWSNPISRCESLALLRKTVFQLQTYAVILAMEATEIFERVACSGYCDSKCQCVPPDRKETSVREYDPPERDKGINMPEG